MLVFICGFYTCYLLKCAENKHTKHRYAKQDEKMLLNRLTAYKSNHLLFMHDCRGDFDNNLSERDLRKESSHKMYCAIGSKIRYEMFEYILE